MSGPYSNADRSQRIANTNKAIEAGYELMCAGHTVFIPHLSHYVEEHALLTGKAQAAAYDLWMRQDIDWLAVCDAMVYLAPSHGADLEKEYAESHGIRVFESVQEAIECLKEAAIG